ncbi:hypothetical protein ACH4ZX_15435 [Streptomyces sp. NPDC020490]|uniref:hypothetical protein n=1 Tax=Streptomyces sp. NPDC020490 TaxID=3365078 RepID=UPI00378F02D6
MARRGHGLILVARHRNRLDAVAERITRETGRSVQGAADDMVDAALAGLDAGESVTIPALPDVAPWDDCQSARQTLSGNLSSSRPAERYLSASTAH